MYISGRIIYIIRFLFHSQFQNFSYQMYSVYHLVISCFVTGLILFIKSH